MRVLVVGNIAQNGYLLAKFLRSAGVDAFLVYDATAPAHWLPMWEDCVIHPRDVEKLSRENERNAGTHWTGRMLEAWQEPSWSTGIASCGNVSDPRWLEPLRRLAGGADATILTGPWAAYGPHLGVPYLTFEHATMRLVPAGEAAGETGATALAAAYRGAAWNVITNADCQRAALALGLTRYSFIPHPVNTDRFTPRGGESTEADRALRWKLTQGHPTRLMFLAPARQATKYAVWGTKNNAVIFEAFRAYLDAPGTPDAQLVAAAYGDSLQEMRALASKLKLDARVTWYPLQPKRTLIDYYRAADVVLDQFDTSVGSYGTCTVEALACGVPVITHIDRELHFWTEVPLPPVYNCSTVEEVASTLKMLSGAQVDERKDCEMATRRWVDRYHSRQIVTDAYVRLLGELVK